MYRTKKGEHAVPTLKLDRRTLVFDRKRNRQVMWIDGVVTVPVGAVIELTSPNLDVCVTGVRLLPAAPATDGGEGSSVGICLDVDVPEEWWGEKD